MISYTNHNIQIATLNCRGLSHKLQKNAAKKFIKYLKTSSLDILAIQESHAEKKETQERLDMQFSSKSSIYTKHCGIISLNDKFTVTPIDTGIEGRFILANIHYATEEEPSSFNAIATILNIYGRATSKKDNVAFYTELMENSFLTYMLTSIQHNLFVVGDFNYKYELKKSDGTVEATTKEWTTFLANHFIDCFREDKRVTWHGTRGTAHILDYIFCNNHSYEHVTDYRQEYLNPIWTDHDMLVITVRLKKDRRQGPGAYKCNPFLAQKKQFRTDLVPFLEGLQTTRELKKTTQTAQEIWDWIKVEVKEYVRQYQLEDLNWRRKQLKRLQSKRNRCMRLMKNRGLIFQVLPTIERQISSLQDSIAEIEVLKLGKYWRENNEKNAGFLKKLTISRQTKRQLKQLRHPETQLLCSDQDTMSEITGNFYTKLYTPDATDDRSTRLLLNQITPDMQLDSEQQTDLEQEIEIDDIIFECKRTPKFSSPGSDGIPYPLLSLILKFPPFKSLLEEIYNDALTKGIFPESWNISLMTLLYKKNDPNDIANFRPLSLCNTDYKLLTRLINRRMMEVAPQLINENQAGFVPGRFIAQNAMRCQVIMEDAERGWNLVKQKKLPNQSDSLAIGLSLDQEKAYDRVNLKYLHAALLKYGFPTRFTRCLMNMMGQNLLRINVNGYFTKDVPKLRGLKQGDPVSAILYNLAIEPFLRSILNDPLYQGYQMKYDATHPLYSTEAPLVHTTKILCYADDALAFVQNRNDLQRLEYHLEIYCKATNAKINYNKVEAISLSGKNTGSYWRNALTDMKITKFTTIDNTVPVTYLGFPLLHSIRQREVFMARFLDNLRTTVKIYNTRTLSVIGKATVLNSLLLSKCWYILRVTPLTLNDIQSIVSIANQYLRKGIFPVIPWSTWIKPKPLGGLGVLDVATQQSALYFRWVQPLLQPSSNQTILDQMLRMLINKRNHSQNVEMALLFPASRASGMFKQRTTTVDMIYRSIDNVPRNFEDVEITTTTARILPLKMVLQVTPLVPKLPVRVKTMTVGDIYTNDTLNSQLKVIPIKNIEQAHRQASKKLLRQIQDDSIRLQPYVTRLIQDSPTETDVATDMQDATEHSTVDFSPFVKKLFPAERANIATTITTKSFRRACATAHCSAIPGMNWKYFWALSLTLVQRNVLYRFLTRSIPHKSILHYFKIIESPTCIVCKRSKEDAEHLLFLCPPKASIWKDIIFEFLWPTVSVKDIIHACSTLDFTDVQYVSKTYTTAPMVIIMTLANIWRAHFRLIFHDAPFNRDMVVKQIKEETQLVHDENEVHKQL